MSSETLSFSDTWAASLEPYLPPPPVPPPPQQPSSPDNKSKQPPSQSQRKEVKHRRPFTTLTYAQSLDSQLALAPGVRTRLSGPESKAMTHFLRSRHAAILVGVGTAVADDPGLNCRLVARTQPQQAQQEQHHPRPVVVDPGARWAVSEESAVVRLAREGKGKGPWVLYDAAEGLPGVVVEEERRRVVEAVGGRYIPVPAVAAATTTTTTTLQSPVRRLAWESVLAVLCEKGVESVMVEGGGTVINDLLRLSNSGVNVVDSVIVTIAPVWLGSGGVAVAPDRPADEQGRGMPGPRLGDVSWVQMGEDMVLCGRVSR